MFHDHLPHIVWPAPGLPALLEGQARRVELIVAHTEVGLDPLFGWARRLALRDRLRGTRVELTIDHLEPLERAAVGASFARGYVELPDANALRFARLVVHVPPDLGPSPPRSAGVLDVMVGDAVERPNAIGVFAPRDRLALAFASDLHVAAFWQSMAEAVARFAPDLAPKFLHPGRLLDRFIDQANSLAMRGELDLVVLGGDLVDHVHPYARRSAAGETNVARLAAALARLEVPAIVLPGNHDHRPFPWRPRLPGLGAAGIPIGRSSRILRDAGLWDPWPLRPSDRHVLRTEDAAGRPDLAYHLALLAPATDFHVTVRGMRLVFASTGRDVLPRWREVEWSRLAIMLRSLRSSRDDPDSEGFTDAQLAVMAAGLDDASGAALFFHAPLLHPRPGEPVERRLDRLDPGDRADMPSQIAFERRLFATGLRRGVVFRNVGPLVRTLASRRTPLTVFSGHVHRSSAIAFDRTSLQVRSMPFAAPQATGQTVSLLTAPALGHIRSPGNEPPGYLLASFDKGQLAALECRRVG